MLVFEIVISTGVHSQGRACPGCARGVHGRGCARQRSASTRVRTPVDVHARVCVHARGVHARLSSQATPSQGSQDSLASQAETAKPTRLLAKGEQYD